MWNINMSQANAESEIKPSRVNKIHSTGLAFGVVFLAGCVCILAFNHRPMFHTSGGIRASTLQEMMLMRKYAMTTQRLWPSTKKLRRLPSN